jgi:hypothetical protein
MKTYNELSSNYLNTKFSFVDMKPFINELCTDLEQLKFTLPKEPVMIDSNFLNLPLIKNIQFTKGINKVKVQETFNQIKALKPTINKTLKPILTKLSTLKFDNIYYYSNFLQYINNFDNSNLYNLSSVSGDKDFKNISNPIINIYLSKLLPSIINDQVVKLKYEAHSNLEVTADLQNLFDSFIISNKQSIIQKITHFITSNIITLSPTYSNYIFKEIEDIIISEFEKLPPLTFKLNKDNIINLIYSAQLNELTLNILNYKDLLPTLTNSELFEIDNYVKEFNNNIANEVVVLNEDTVVKLQAISGQFKSNPTFFINSFYTSFNSASDIFKSTYSDIFLPPNFSKDMIKLTLDNINRELPLYDFRAREKELIDFVVNKYLISVMNTYLTSQEFTNFVLNLLTRLNKYNLQSTTYFYPTQQYIKLMFMQFIVNKNLFSEISDQYYKTYNKIVIDQTVTDVSKKIDKLYNYSKLDIDYYDSEIFNFFYSSVLYNIAESIVYQYRI